MAKTDPYFVKTGTAVDIFRKRLIYALLASTFLVALNITLVMSGYGERLYSCRFVNLEQASFQKSSLPCPDNPAENL
jgi:hypothetical protein